MRKTCIRDGNKKQRKKKGENPRKTTNRVDQINTFYSKNLKKKF